MRLSSIPRICYFIELMFLLYSGTGGTHTGSSYRRSKSLYSDQPELNHIELILKWLLIIPRILRFELSWFIQVDEINSTHKSFWVNKLKLESFDHIGSLFDTTIQEFVFLFCFMSDQNQIVYCWATRSLFA